QQTCGDDRLGRGQNRLFDQRRRLILRPEHSGFDQVREIKGVPKIGVLGDREESLWRVRVVEHLLTERLADVALHGDVFGGSERSRGGDYVKTAADGDRFLQTVESAARCMRNLDIKTGIGEQFVQLVDERIE